MDKLLNMLVIFINERVRACKISLETEEKSREMSYLQGRIAGYRTLLYFLKEHFELTPSFIEDSGEIPADIGSLTNSEIRELSIVAEGLGISDNWENLITAVNQRKEELKSFLLHEAESARDLYVSQGNYEALVCYERLFSDIQKEYDRRAQELPFDDGGKAAGE